MDAAQLDSLYNQFNSYIFQHFEFFWSIIIGIFAIISIALYFIVKSSIKSGIEKGAEQLGLQIKALASKVEKHELEVQTQKDMMLSVNGKVSSISDELAKHRVEHGVWSPALIPYGFDTDEGFVIEAEGSYNLMSDTLFINAKIVIIECPPHGMRVDKFSIGGLPFSIEPIYNIQNFSGRATMIKTGETCEYNIKASFTTLFLEAFQETKIQNYHITDSKYKFILLLNGYFRVQ